MTQKRKPINRRQFLGIAGGVLGASVLVCSGSAYLGFQPTAAETINEHMGENTMTSKKILIAYASRCGSTAEVAQAVGERLAAKNGNVDVLPVGQVKNLSGYQAVVIGSALRMGKILSGASSFAGKFRQDLAALPTAYFTVGMGMREDTPQERENCQKAMQPLNAVRAADQTGMFAGKVDKSKLEPFWRFLLSFDTENGMPEADWRDWDKIRAWGDELAGLWLS